LLVCISRAGKDLASGCAGVLLVSPYNVAWRSYVQAGGLEVSEFCFFLVFFPARCVSSISARFLLYGAHAICFLPLVTILDPSLVIFFFKLVSFIQKTMQKQSDFFPQINCNYTIS
jgi:hypothetical protein